MEKWSVAAQYAPQQVVRQEVVAEKPAHQSKHASAEEVLVAVKHQANKQ